MQSNSKIEFKIAGLPSETPDEIRYSIEDCAKKVTIKLMNLEEEYIRNQLIKRGWLPPECVEKEIKNSYIRGYKEGVTQGLSVSFELPSKN